MKIPRPIDEAGYERELNRAITRFERKTALIPRQLDPKTMLGRLWRALKDSPVPLTVHEAHDAAGIESPLRRMGPRFQQLLKLGWVERDGTKDKIWGRPRPMVHKVATFRALDNPFYNRGRQIENALPSFLSAVDLLDRRRLTNRCCAMRLVVGMNCFQGPRKVSPARDAEIYRRRLCGETQKSIAADFGITSERVRQIFQRAVVRGEL